jgi:hypothetical protein
MAEHSDECYECVSGKVRVIEYICPGMSLYRFLFALNEVFFLTFQVNSDTLYAVLLYIGPSENAAKYKYKFAFVNDDDTVGVTVMNLTRSFDEELEDIIESGNCGKVHYDVVSRLENKESGLKCKTKIFRVGD